MSKLRNVLGLVGGIALVLSSAAHSLLGWPQLRAELGKAGVPADLVFGVKVGWQFGGVAMLVFGLIAVALFVRRLRGGEVPTGPAAIVGLAYLAFAAWALVASSFNPFFLVFVIPGLLLLFAVAGRWTEREGRRR